MFTRGYNVTKYLKKKCYATLYFYYISVTWTYLTDWNDKIL